MPGLYFVDGASFAAPALGLDARLQRAAARLGYRAPTLVQAEAIPVALAGKDVLLRASTGSGKTAAYGLALLQRILSARAGASGGPGGGGVLVSSGSPVAVVLVPTRELVDQTLAALNGLAHYCRDTLRIAGLGGAKIGESTGAASSCDVLIGTPSRIAAAAAKGTVSLSRAEALVIDEADLCLSYGHEADVKAVTRALPAGFQGWLVSATLSPALAELKSLVLQSPAVLTLHDGGAGGGEAGTASLAQLFYRCASADRPLILFSLLRLKLVAGRTLIFVNTVDSAIRLKLFLGRFGISAAALNAQLPANSRAHVIEQFNKGVFDILVATDEGQDASGADSEGVDGPIEEFERVVADAGAASKGEEDKAAIAVSADGKSRKRSRTDPLAAAADAAAAGVVDAPRSKRRVRIVEPGAAGGEEEDDDDDDMNTNADDTAPLQVGGAGASRGGADAFEPARGIDFRGVTTVINYDFPTSLTSYVHRIGRTARGGAAGVALSLAPPLGVSRAVDKILTRLASSRSPLAPLAPPAPLPFSLADVEGFRYRVNDVMRALTASAVHAARLSELKREALASSALTAHWEDHPADVAVLSHTARADLDGKSRGRVASQRHLKDVPSYLLPDSLREALDAAGAGVGKGRRGGKKRRGGTGASKAAGAKTASSGAGGGTGVGGFGGPRRTGPRADPLKSFAVNASRVAKV